jgi:succinoglycan biosynthesis protein ExoL
MISILTSLKPFKGGAIRLQENALSNWRRLNPNIEIILYGDGHGISERAYSFGAKHVSNIKSNSKGIPDFSAIAEHAALYAKFDIQVYLNGDILLPPDFIEQINLVSIRQYLIVGQRIDLACDAVFNPLTSDWNGEIRRCALVGQAQLHDPTGVDYFVFPRGLWKGLAPLIIGRAGYDNALIANCLRKRIPIIDATWSIHAVHQWHDYSHVKGVSETYDGDEALTNKRLHDIEHSSPNIEEAKWRLIGGRIVTCKGSSNLFRRIEVMCRYHWRMKHVSYVCRAITRIAWLGGWLKMRVLPLDLIVRLNSDIRILTILPAVGDPLYSKRIAMLQDKGFPIEAVGFERAQTSGRPPGCSALSLGKLADGRYLSRIPKLLAALPVLRRAIRRNKVVYAAGTDMAMTAVIAGFGLGKPVIMEVADIQRIQVAKGLMGRFVRILERCVVACCRLLVVTAPGFVDRYYHGWLHAKVPTMVLENKLDAVGYGSDIDVIREEKKGIPLVDRPLIIGYFGVLRCDWSWRILEALASSKQGKVKIIVAGRVTHPVDLPERAARLTNVEFRGVYSSPGDLPKLYGDVDLVWACYPSPEVLDSDWHWAQAVCRSNRFYESCCFQRPIITMAHSGDSVDVERYGIGIVIHKHELQEIWESLSNIKASDWIQFRANLSRLPRSVYRYTAEGDELATAIRRIEALAII